ncbi:hypothetical protein B0H10DRAFT_1967806, partial [Mycena sp. CBHHK59/15]
MAVKREPTLSHRVSAHSRDSALGTVRFAHLPSNSFLAIAPLEENDPNSVKAFTSHIEIGLRTYKVFEALMQRRSCCLWAVFCQKLRSDPEFGQILGPSLAGSEVRTDSRGPGRPKVRTKKNLGLNWETTSGRINGGPGTDLLDLLHVKQPELVEKWALKVSLPVIAAEGTKLSDLLRPDSTKDFSSRLETWLLDKMLSEATIAAPNLCELLMLMGMTSDVGRRDNKLARNERANEFQEIMGTYFLACSTPRRQFEFWLMQEKACMIVWDNLNIAFKVGEQRHNSKDTFENGTTATLIVLYGVLRGELELELLEPRTNRRPVFDFEPMDTLPTVEHIIQAQQSSLWHVRRIFLEHFPTLAAKFKADLGDVPIIWAIPLHQSEHLPTPAMKIVNPALTATIDFRHNGDTHPPVDCSWDASHGVMFAGGDLLSLNLQT